MDCPRCGAAGDGAPECPRCGVILAKARAARPRPSPLPASAQRADAPEGARPLLLVAFALGLALVGALVYTQRARRADPAQPAASQPAAATAPEAEPPAPPEGAPAPPALAQPAVPVPDSTALASAAAQEDRALAQRLLARLRSSGPLAEQDLRAAEDLYARLPVSAALLEAVLVRTAQQEQASQRHASAASLLQRALAVAPQSLPARRTLVAVRLAQADWAGVESAARELLAVVPGDGELVRSLAYALVRQDRGSEAVEVLEAQLESRPDPATQALLERVRADAAAEAPLGSRNLAHFHVRYDGAAHEDAGRLVLRVLDRHYATLVSRFAHQPSAPIPVVLLSEESYYDATGAPAWAAGHYDTFDGRVRIPIGGLSSAPAPDLDRVVLHELTHAFVSELSAGLAPREIQEGLAQLVEGRSSRQLLRDEGLQALAEGRIRGVDGFYLAALALVEDLLAQRGQGGINDLLAAIARTRDVDEAFRQVYGRDWSALQAEWAARFRQRHAR